MRKQLTKRDFDVPKYYCFVWGGGVGAVKNTIQLIYIIIYTVNGVTEKLFFILDKCDGYTRTECTLLKHRMITCCV